MSNLLQIFLVTCFLSATAFCQIHGLPSGDVCFELRTNPDSEFAKECFQNLDECQQGIQLIQNGITCDSKCEEHGKCVLVHGNLKCNCTKGYYGNACSFRIVCNEPSSPNNGHVRCNDTVNLNSTCTFSCDVGYRLNGNQTTTCIEDSNDRTVGIWTSEPPECEDIDDCESNPCQNQANCSDLLNGYTCDCLPKYAGKNCSEAQNLYPISCADVGGPSGIYTIQPVTFAPGFQVYCDMTTDGGNWTLIASIHENNIHGKCTLGDKWSSEQGTSSVFESSLGNWENTNIFGSLESATSQDYKNPAYYTLNVSDMMIWHVPNHNQIYDINGAATLKYYTTNGFLNKSTLQNLYTKSFSTKKAEALVNLEDILTTLQRNQQTITSKIPNWYNYRYDLNLTQPSSIWDGGNDMYDGGNKVSFKTDNSENFTKMIYNIGYSLDEVEVSNSATYPFVALAWIGNNSGINSTDYFEYRVSSNYGADGGGNYAVYASNEISQGQMSAKYTAFLVYNAYDPSICEVYFYISSAKWKSRTPIALERLGWKNSTRKAKNIVRFTGQPSNLLIGYTLLSKTNGQIVTPGEIKSVLQEYMSIAMNVQFKPDFVEPVTYARGNNETILNGIPTMYRNEVIPGYIQILALNSAGFYNALCPGIAVNSNNAERMCIGGESTSQGNISICGDFAGWKGKLGDQEEAQPSNTGRSMNDINSSILIFVR